MGDVSTFIFLTHVRAVFEMLTHLLRFPISSQQDYVVDRGVWVNSTHMVTVIFC